MLLTSVVSSDDLPGLNIKIPEEPLSRRKLDKEAGSVYDELEQTLTYMLSSQDTSSTETEISMRTKEIL